MYITNSIRKRCWAYIGHTLTMNEDRIPRQIFLWTPDGKRKQGRPKTILEVKKASYNKICIPTLCYQSQTWTPDARTIRKITTTEIRCVRRMTGNSLKDRIRNENLRKRFGIQAAINYIKRQQIKWFGHVIRQKELNITHRVINKKYENTRPKGRPRKRRIDGILEALRNITAEEANRRANDRKLPPISTLRSN
jgi:hypothetical protein